MKTTYTPTKSNAFHPDLRSGNTLVVVVFVILLTSLILSTMFVASRQRTFVLTRQSDRLQALVIAETGLHQAFRVMAEEDAMIPEDGGLLLPGSSFSGGSYSVRISRPDGADDGVWLLRSRGVFRQHEREVAALVGRGMPSGDGVRRALLGPYGNAALLAGGQLIIAANADIDIGNNGAHANGSVLTNGGPTLVAGFITSNGEIRISTNTDLTVDAQEDFLPDLMVLPSLDVQAFREYATANGSFISGDHRIRGSDNHPAGGVLFVDGDVRMNANAVLTGIIIATGNITINGNATVSNTTDYPALVSTGGDIRINGGADIGGWVFAMNGDVNGNGGADGIIGIVASGNIDLSGGYSLSDDADPDGFTWPGRDDHDDGDEQPGQLVLLSWMR